MPTTMNVSLPEALKDFVDEQVSEGDYSSTSDYVRELIRERRKRAAEGKLRSVIAEGLASGPARAVTAEDWARRRKRLPK
jgi:antitoxin ParD1/3/4